MPWKQVKGVQRKVCLFLSETWFISHVFPGLELPCERPPKPPTCWNSYTRDIDTWYDHETLRNDRGDTKNDDFWYTCLPDFIANIKSPGTMRDTQKTMTTSATSFLGCNRFSPLLMCVSFPLLVVLPSPGDLNSGTTGPKLRRKMCP